METRPVGSNEYPMDASPITFDKIAKFFDSAKKSVKLSALPDVYVKLRKRTNLYAVTVLAGTDVQVYGAHELQPALGEVKAPWQIYKPNLHVEAYDRIFNGVIALSTKNNEITYTKKFLVANLNLGVSALFNYKTLTPYGGFVLESTPGVSSAARSNTFSISHSFNLPDVSGLDTHVAFQASVQMPGTRYNPITGTMGMSAPIDVKLHSVTTTLII